MKGLRSMNKLLSLMVCLLLAVLTLETTNGVERPKSKGKTTATDPFAGQMPRHRPLTIGDKGSPFTNQFKVVQVLSDTSVLVGMFWEDKVPEPDDPGKVIGKTNLVVIADYPTKGMIDGRLFDCVQQFEAVGTVRAQNLVGTTNYLLLKPVKDK